MARNRIELGEVHPAWSGWVLSSYDGRLYSPEWSRGFLPEYINAMPYHLAALNARRSEIEQLRKASQAAQEALDAAEARAAFYRSQLVLESRYGLMIAAFAA